MATHKVQGIHSNRHESDTLLQIEILLNKKIQKLETRIELKEAYIKRIIAQGHNPISGISLVSTNTERLSLGELLPYHSPGINRQSSFTISENSPIIKLTSRCRKIQPYLLHMKH